MKLSKVSLWWRAIILGFSMTLFVVPAYAVHELGVFELDGDAADNVNIDGDDWQNIYDKTDSSNATTGIIADPSPVSIFTGGRKDIQDITQWKQSTVEKGQFREDLYYRLQVLKIKMPPLRELEEDIERIATHYLEIFSANQLKFAPVTLERIHRYQWPGNIRELRNRIQRACILSAGN